MNTIVQRRIGKTGRPLGVLDVLSKVAETAVAGLRVAVAGRREAARRRQVAREAAAVRRLADGQRHIAPGFASDLYAAADQHELRTLR